MPRKKSASVTLDNVGATNSTTEKTLSPRSQVATENNSESIEEVKPKRKRRTPAEMAIFRAQEAERKLERQRLLAEKKSARETIKKIVAKVSELGKNSAQEKLVGRGLAQRNSAEKVETDFKSDGKEKLFALDIGTRSVIGIVAEKNSAGQLEIIATHREEHKTRAMLDGQIHDVPQVAAVINTVRDKLKETVGELKSVAVAAAGRALYTMTAVAELELNGGLITAEQQSSLDFAGVQLAQSMLAESHTIADRTSYYCVGFSVISYELDDVRLKSLIGQRGKLAKAKVIATFLPRQVIDSMQSALGYSRLDMKALTLEPIAAINVLIPPSMRHLNLVLVDIGAGTSDVAITKNGTVIAYGMVPIAGDEITEGLSQKFLLDFNVAEEVKRKATLGEFSKFNDILGGVHNMTAAEVIEALADSTANLAGAIAKTVYDLNGEETPQAVMLVGGGALTPNLQKYVAEALNIPEQRVGVRKPDVIEGIASIPKELCSPDSVTPLGILKIASSNTLHFLTVYVNNSEYSLFHFRELTVSDALLNAGIQLKKWSGKPGLALMLTVDGEKKFFPGSMGTQAKLTLNGQSATLETKIENDSIITVERGEDGKIPELKLSDVVRIDSSFSVEINGKEETVTPKITVNDEVSLPTRILKDGDEVKTLSARTIGEVLRLAGYPPTGRKVYYTLNGRRTHYTCTPEIFMDDSEVSISLPIHAGDKIEYIEKSNPKVSDVLNISNLNSKIKILYNDESYSIPIQPQISLTVNGRVANMNTIVEDDAEIFYQKTDRKSATVSDALLAVDFVPPDPKSRMTFEIKLNGELADFATPVYDGDKLEIILRTHEGVELPATTGKKVTVENLTETTLPQVNPKSVSVNESQPRKKLTIEDFIRND